MAEAVYGRRVFTEKGIFTAEKIVIAAHYPFRNVPGFYFLVAASGAQLCDCAIRLSEHKGNVLWN